MKSRQYDSIQMKTYTRKDKLQQYTKNQIRSISHNVKISLPFKKNNLPKQNAINQSNDYIWEQMLQYNASQFIHQVKQRKAKAKGRFFTLRHQEEQRKRLSTQIQECQKHISQRQEQLKRRSLAVDNINIFRQRSRIRSEALRLSRHQVTKAKDAKNKRRKPKSKDKKGKQKYKNGFIDQQIPLNNLSGLKNQSFFSVEYQEIEQARENLAKLFKLIKKQRRLLALSSSSDYS